MGGKGEQNTKNEKKKVSLKTKKGVGAPWGSPPGKGKIAMNKSWGKRKGEKDLVEEKKQKVHRNLMKKGKKVWGEEKRVPKEKRKKTEKGGGKW